jgi:hypothetical protein
VDSLFRVAPRAIANERCYGRNKHFSSWPGINLQREFAARRPNSFLVAESARSDAGVAYLRPSVSARLSIGSFAPLLGPRRCSRL